MFCSRGSSNKHPRNLAWQIISHLFRRCFLVVLHVLTGTKHPRKSPRILTHTEILKRNFLQKGSLVIKHQFHFVYKTFPRCAASFNTHKASMKFCTYSNTHRESLKRNFPQRGSLVIRRHFHFECLNVVCVSASLSRDLRQTIHKQTYLAVSS